MLGRRVECTTCFLSTELNFCRRNALKSIVPGGFPIPTNIVLKYTLLNNWNGYINLESESRQETNQLQVEENHGNHPNGLSHFSICNNINTSYTFHDFPVQEDMYTEM